jgi:2'-hydroxyisoflavone reductase
LGPALVEAARARGHILTLFNRGKTHPELFPDLEKLHGDRDGHLEVLAGRRWDAVIDTSGYVPRIVRQSAELLAPSVGHYTFISTISVYADGLKPGMDESAPLETVPDPRSEDVPKYYGGLKVLCERTVEAALPGRAAIIRPGLIVGPRDPTDRFTYWPVRIARGGSVLAPGDGSDPVQFIDVRDLATWTLDVATLRLTGTYNATGPAEPLLMRALLDACLKASSGPAQLVWVDTAFLEREKVAPWSDLPVWVPGQGDSAGITRIDCRHAIARGLRFRPVAETIRDTLDWWAALPEERRAKLRAGLPQEREAALLAAWAKTGGRP